MKWNPSLFLLLSPVVASSAPYKRFEPRTSGISWSPCQNQSKGNFDCGYFEVPLDWTNESVGKARLAVVKYPATNSPRKGVLFTTSGWPSSSGVDFVLYGGKFLSNLTGGYFDIVSWDSRGVGSTTPGPINCFSSLEEHNKFWNGTLVSPRIDISHGFSDHSELDYFNSQVSNWDQRLRAFGEVCLKHETSQFLPYIGTVAAVRDLIAIAEYFDGTGCDINYYGFGHGTILGNYLINMFPERVGRVILDGVENPLTYASGPSHLSWAHSVGSADETLQDFAQECALAGSSGCPLATNTSTGPGIVEWTRSLISAAHDYAKSSGDEDFKSVDFVTDLHTALFSPPTWRAAFASGGFYRFYEAVTAASGSNLPLATRSTRMRLEWKRRSSQGWPDFTLHAITCGDSPDQRDVTTKDVFEEFVRVVKDVSPMFGIQFPQPCHFCHRWPTRAVERFAGPWNSTLKNPIIIIGNKADPSTPFLGASRVAGWLGDSATLVELDAYGHTSFGQASNCIFNTIANYFVHDVRPSKRYTVCGVDADASKAFSSMNVMDSGPPSDIPNRGKNGTFFSQELQDLRSQNRVLFIGVIVLAVEWLVVFVSLVIMCFFRKRIPGYKRVDNLDPLEEEEFTSLDVRLLSAEYRG